MTRTVDVAIVGGGVVGSSIAYFLKGELGFAGSVLVVEKDPSYAESSTARSAGGIRQQFSIRENIAMSQFGIEFLRVAPDRLMVDGEKPSFSFVEGGYLFLASDEGLAQLRRNHALQTQCGAAIAWLEPEALRARFPWISAEGVAAACYGLRNEGWLDPFALLQAFRRKARACGAVYETDSVTGLARVGAGVIEVTLAAGRTLAAGIVVNAAGPAAGAVAAMLGIRLPVAPRSRSVFVVHCRERVAPCPLTIDPTGVWFRPEGENFICGVSPPEDEDPEGWRFEVDYALFDDVVWPTLAHRVPAFEALKRVNAWVGHYDYNALDQNAILGPHPELRNFYFANGFSGHGLQQSPAVGRAIAELICHGGYRALDLSIFAYDRIAAGRPVKELNVV